MVKFLMSVRITPLEFTGGMKLFNCSRLMPHIQLCVMTLRELNVRGKLGPKGDLGVMVNRRICTVPRS
jgi:hypothetical protein